MRQFLDHLKVSWGDTEYDTDRVMFSVGLVFGLVLLNPFVDTFGSARGYTFMSQFPEWAWGLLLVSIALVRLWTIAEQHLAGRRNIALLSMGIWLFIAWGFMISNPAGTGWPVYGLIAYHDSRIYWRGKGLKWTSTKP